MYSIINSTNHYYNPESIQIQITQDNKCIIQSILNSQNNSPNESNNIQQNNINNKNIANGQSYSNYIPNNSINNQINTLKDNKNQNYINNQKNEEDNINNNGDENLLISFSNISELNKTNMNKDDENKLINGKNNIKDNLNIPSICNYFEVTPENNNRNYINNTYNNDIKKKN